MKAAFSILGFRFCAFGFRLGDGARARRRFLAVFFAVSARFDAALS